MDLTDEETKLLDHYSVDGLPRALIEAQNAYEKGGPEDHEANRRYLLVLNLIHELGHNLNLTHNENDTNGAYSIIHASIMNYRYQFSGVVPGPSGILADTYSYGTNPSALCYESPKYRCLAAVYAAQYYFGDIHACAWLDANCDTDVNEWNNWVTTDYVNGTQNPNPGVGPGVQAGASATAVLADGSMPDPARLAAARAALGKTGQGPGVARSVLQPLSESELADRRAAIARNLSGGSTGRFKPTSADAWVGPVPEVSLAHRKALVQAQVADLTANRGLVQDKDFFVSNDGTTVTQKCQ